MNQNQINQAKKKTEEWQIKDALLSGIRRLEPPPMSKKYKEKIDKLQNKRKKKWAKQDKKNRDKCFDREIKQQQQRNIWNNDYKSYLQSPEWQKKRKQKLQEAEFRCQICNARQKELHIHHRTYTRIFNEKMIDLTVLCNDCHALFHQQKWSAEIVETLVNEKIREEFGF